MSRKSDTYGPGTDRPRSRNIRALGMLGPFLLPYRWVMVAALAALAAAATATLVLPIAVRRMIDLGFSSENAAFVDQYFAGLFAIAAALAVFSALRFYLVSWLGEKVVADVRRAVYDRVVRMGPAFFETTRTGEVLSRLTTDTTLVQSIAGVNLSIALRSALTLAGGMLMLGITSPKLTGMVLVLVPVVLVPLIGYGRRVRRLSRASQDRIADASAVASETLNAVQTVQAFTLETLQSDRFGDSVMQALETALARIRARAWLTAIAILIVFGAIVFVLRMGAHAVIADEMTAGELGQFLLYAILVAGSFASLSEMWSEVQRAAGAVERLGELLQAQPDIADPPSPRPLPSPARGGLHFDDVSFSYPSRPNERALDGFSLTIAPGETVALVGPSGAGKSTVFQLVLRFYDPHAGSISVDGVPIAEARLAEVRERLGIVAQETVLFAESALENIRYGRPDASDDEVIAAARAAAAHEFIERLPEGYKTFLGERGTRLSGGQRQRIAIARAILRNPPILLLDEATSALDAESEQLVQVALEHAMENRTTLVIAHRLATIKQAKRIVVMDQGRVVATGTHDSLIAQGGLYARLAELQFGLVQPEAEDAGNGERAELAAG